jgi:hypothetical protein
MAAFQPYKQGLYQSLLLQQRHKTSCACCAGPGVTREEERAVV